MSTEILRQTVAKEVAFTSHLAPQGFLVECGFNVWSPNIQKPVLLAMSFMTTMFILIAPYEAMTYR